LAQDEFRFGRRGNLVGLLVTLALHGGVLAAVGLASARSAPPLIVERDFVSAELVKLGKPRDKFWLPRIVQPPRPKAPPPTLNLTEDANAAPAPKEAPKVDDADISKDMRRALKRAQLLAQAASEEPAEGSLTGSAEGTSTQGVSGDAWATAVNNAIKNAWVTPVGLITDSELQTLVAKVQISISDDGTLSNPVVKKSSGNPYFDDSCIQAVKAAGKVPPPPAKSKHILISFDGAKLAR